MVKDYGRSRFEGEKKFILRYVKLRMIFKGVFIFLKVCFYEKIFDKGF